MTQKHIKFTCCDNGRNDKNDKNKGKHFARPSSKCKPVIISHDDVEQMAVESSRAKLVNQLIGKQEMHHREFGSYFLGARNKEPSCLITSHSNSTPKRGSVVTTYPSLVQGLRWNPHIETSTIEDYGTEMDSSTEMDDTSKYSCKCETCRTKNCPSRVSSSSTLKPNVFRDNIMTFVDQYTMTPRVNDVAIGASIPIPTKPKTSDMSVLATEMGYRDTPFITKMHQDYDMPERYAPTPILKKTDYDDYGNQYSRNKKKYPVPLGLQHEAVRDTDAFDEPSKSRTSFFKPKKKKSIESIPEPSSFKYVNGMRGKTLYNEGITDEMCYSPRPITLPSFGNLTVFGSKTSGITSRYMESDIPFCHRSESKYHHNCTNPKGSKPYEYESDTEDVKRVLSRSKIMRKPYRKQVSKPARVPTISFPRRVLTSERDVDYYVKR